MRQDAAFAASTHLEILDLRHFSAPALRPLLEEEVARWERRLSWDYSRSVELLLEYIDNRSLTGYVALRQGRVAGYAFGVCEAAKAVVGDVFAFGEAEQRNNSVCDLLLQHLLETLGATPGIQRIESQLLLFPEGALGETFTAEGFRRFPRCFMVSDIDRQRLSQTRARRPPLPPNLGLERWAPEAYLPTAALIQEAYCGHTDADINDQYRTLPGAQRFLHNIVHFPGCGVFDPGHSWIVRNGRSGSIEGAVLCSRVHTDVAHITQLCVRTSARRHGLGATLLEYCLLGLAQHGFRSVSLTVTAGNTQALDLYAQKGFRVQHRFEAWVWEKSGNRA